MPAIVIYVFLILGGLGAFLVGMKLLQESTERLATSSLSKLFTKTSKNKFIGAGLGMASTMVMQSSSATTVMIVGFVNAGVMTLAQAAAYIIGANIGTTITAQIVALSAFPFSEFIIALTLFGAFITMFVKKDKLSSIGSLICGIGLLFLGLFVMKSNLSSIFEENNFVSEWLVAINNPLVLFLIGAVLTGIFQSSSAVTSVIIALALAGVVVGGSGNGVLYVILGTNIGSCTTALISSIGSTTNGKRASVIHLLFNSFGSILFFIILLCWPQFNETIFQRLFKEPATQIAMFHSFFNIATALIFLPLSGLLVKLSMVLVPDKSKKTGSLLDERFLNNPSVALTQSLAYYRAMADKALQALNVSMDAFFNRNLAKTNEIKEIVREVDDMSNKLVPYLVRINSIGVNEEENRRISNLHHDIADITRLAEVADNITKYTDHCIKDNLQFSSVVMPDIKKMLERINNLFTLSLDVSLSPSLDNLALVEQEEQAIDDLRTSLVSGHIERLNLQQCQPASAGIFINLVGNLERIGDHLTFISERACQGLEND